jgi:ATP diphosphatase
LRRGVTERLEAQLRALSFKPQAARGQLEAYGWQLAAVTEGNPMYSLQDMLHLMERLRDPKYGCPWDVKQNYASIVPHTLEEAYEVADAIERGDFDDLKGELGDLLFQVVYYSQLAREEGRFEFDGVIDGITRKLIRRHPHVFPTGDLYAPLETPRLTDDEVKQRWEEIKIQERADKAVEPEQLSLLDDVPAVLPALSRAAKLQKRASQVGFDWPDALPVVDNIREELDEVLEAMAENDAQAIAEEVGDLLFAAVNLARHLKVDPENALRAANIKFERRFRFIEQALRQTHRPIEDCTLEEMDALWGEAKRQEKNVPSCG